MYILIWYTNIIKAIRDLLKAIVKHIPNLNRTKMLKSEEISGQSHNKAIYVLPDNRKEKLLIRAKK